MSHEVLLFSELETADIPRGVICLGDSKGTFADEPIAKLFKVGNQGGIRWIGSAEAPLLVALVSNQKHEDWPDEIDERTGVVRYYGDNRTSVDDLHKPPGNQLLCNLFRRGFSTMKDRMLAPPFFVFTAPTEPGLPGRSHRFRGLAVPGAPTVQPEDWLVARWFDSPDGRFQNYVLTLQLLDVPLVPRAWIDELGAGDVLGRACPIAYRQWVEHGHI